MTYDSWIEAYVARHAGIVLGKCREASEEMVKTFPELRVVRGHVYDGLWGRRGHWWCESPDGSIVDPTRSQFPAPFEYEEFKAGMQVRAGCCANCGEDIMVTIDDLDDLEHGITCPTVCGERCHEAYVAYLG